MKYSIGVDGGGTKVAYGLFDSESKLIDRYEHPTRTKGSAEEILKTISDSILDLLAKHNLQTTDLMGVGMLFPSFIDYEEGYILKTSNIPPLKKINARHFFEQKLNTRIVLDNDTNGAALAEHRLGAGKGFKHMLYCAVSTGIANGIIINNQVFRGSYGAAGESGHMLITPGQGVACACGNRGCFESYVSGSKIVEHVKLWLQQDKYSSSIILDLVDNKAENINAAIINKAAKNNDPLALKAVEQMAYYLGLWLFNIYQILNINCYIFGGGLLNFGDLLFDPVKENFYSFLKNHGDHPIYFKEAELGNDFGIIGAELLLSE